MSSYAWIITRDHITNRARAIFGPSDVNDEQVSALGHGGGQEFRLCDDDDITCLTGRFIGDLDGEDGFAPLDDYGAPAVGCTSIEYRQPDGSWAAL